MGLLESIGKLVQRAFPGFPKKYVTRLGVVVAVEESPSQEGEIGSRFRPRYALKVQVLNEKGEKDESFPLLEGLEGPAFALGHGGGVFGLPLVGTKVRLGFDYGSAAFPYIQALLPTGDLLPALSPGELVLRSSEGSMLSLGDGAEVLAPGGTKLETGKLEVDSGDLSLCSENIEAKALGVKVEVQGSTELKVGGVLNMSSGTGMNLLTPEKLSLLASSGVQVGSEKIDMQTHGSGLTLEAANAKLESLGGGLEVGETEVELKTPGVGLKLTPAQLSLGSASTELLEELVLLIQHMALEQHQTAVGPTSPPMNSIQYEAVKQKLSTLKA